MIPCSVKEGGFLGGNFLKVFLDFSFICRFVGLKTVFFEFLLAKSCRIIINFVKNSVLDPKQAKLNQQSEIWAHMGPARALEESVGPARALEERDNFRKNAPLFFQAHFYGKMLFLVSRQ